LFAAAAQITPRCDAGVRQNIRLLRNISPHNFVIEGGAKAF
jgi:hypothetical protein